MITSSCSCIFTHQNTHSHPLSVERPCVQKWWYSFLMRILCAGVHLQIEVRVCRWVQHCSLVASHFVQ
ncbi:hypothetical protein CsSME_00053194 [Camellia sinensis var. sinensis]